MNERLLQFIWQFQYYQNINLFSTNNEPLQIISPGVLNKNQGPDFLNAKINIANTLFVGSVEIHVNASEWERHKHQTDNNYSNVILHVVWQEDKKLNVAFPTLVLQHLVSSILLKKYKALMDAPFFIPCASQINLVSSFTLASFKDRLIIERLQEKAADIQKILAQNNNHWEDTFWQLLAKNFGIKVNSQAFQSMAKSINLTILAKHKNQLHQLEALMLGQCGLLENDFKDDYAIMLQKEFQFLKQKYKLVQNTIPTHFLRMRPANFPTIRLAQLAALIFNSYHLFSKIKDADHITQVEQMFTVMANDYWHYHYNFDVPTPYKPKNLGKQMIQNIIINTIIPVLYAYGWYNNNELYKLKALQWIECLLPEKNTITTGFQQLKIKNKSAYDSQALIQLKNKYCNLKRCLECAIGNQILKLRE